MKLYLLECKNDQTQKWLEANLVRIIEEGDLVFDEDFSFYELERVIPIVSDIQTCGDA